MNLKNLVGKLTASWGKAGEQLDEKGRPAPVVGKNVRIETNDSYDFGDQPYIEQFQKPRSEDPSFHIAG